MFMGGIAGRQRMQRGGAKQRPCPPDFALQFVRIGRVACQEHYHTGRLIVDRWLEQCGKDKLIAERAAFVRSHSNRDQRMAAFIEAFAKSGMVEKACRDAGVSKFAVYAWRRDHPAFAEEWERVQPERMSLVDVGRILSRAYPIGREPSPSVVRNAAQHLRIKRNGGFFISPSADGTWLVGQRRVFASELVDMAKARGFDPPSLTGERGGEVGSG